MGYDASVTLFLGAQINSETAQLYIKTYHPETYTKLQQEHDGDWDEFISEQYLLSFNGVVEFEYNSHTSSYYIICSNMVKLYNYGDEHIRHGPINLIPNLQRYLELTQSLKLPPMLMYSSSYISA